jgi:hypothetical protein
MEDCRRVFRRHASDAVPVIMCMECKRQIVVFARGWRAYLTDDTFGPEEAVVYCPDCAERELGAPPITSTDSAD